MPKTRDAFALREFDERRILQRPFFKDFHFGEELTDDEIFLSLSAQVEDSIPELEQKQSEVETLSEFLSQYLFHIKRHVDRLLQYCYNTKVDTLSDGFRRAWGLETAYVKDISIAIEKLDCDIKFLLEESKKNLCRRRRKFFAQRLKEAREREKLSRSNIAFLLGYSLKGYSGIESGRNEPNLTVLIQLSRILNVSVDWLLGLT